MTFCFARNYCKVGCTRQASRQPWGASWCPGRTACRLSRTSLPSASPWGLCWGLGSLSPAGLQQLPASTAQPWEPPSLQGQTRRGGAGCRGLMQGHGCRGDGDRGSMVPSSPGQVRARLHSHAGGSGRLLALGLRHALGAGASTAVVILWRAFPFMGCLFCNPQVF